MSFKVAIVGHSNVPVRFHHPGASVSIFRKGGALLKNFYSEPALNRVLDEKFDLVFTWLGSNDVEDGKGTLEIPRLTLELAKDIKSKTGAQVIVIDIEPRVCPVRYHTTTKAYKKIAKGINDKILKKRGDHHGVLHVEPFLKFHINESGCHYTREGRRILEGKISNQIRRIMSQNNRNDGP